MSARPDSSTPDRPDPLRCRPVDRARVVVIGGGIVGLAVAERLLAVPAALEGYAETLREGIRIGVVPARRQVELVAEQARKIAAPRGFFAELAAEAAPAAGSLPASLAQRLERHASRLVRAHRAGDAALRCAVDRRE